MIQDTSFAAFISIDHETLGARVLAHLEISTDGYTCDELEQVLRGKHQTISASLSKAKKAGLIKDTGKRRKTRSGRNAIVWDLINQQTGTYL